VTRIRQQASDSDLVVVNHHLLCADAAMRHGEVGAVIPECEVAIVDEAHQLEDVATQFFGRTVSNHRVEDLVKDAERLLTLHALGDIEHDFRRSATRVRDRGARFFHALDCLRPPRAGGVAEDRMRLAPDKLEPAHDPGLALCDAFDSLRAAVAIGRELPEDVQAVGRRAGEMCAELSFLLEAGDPDFVYYLERRGRGLYLRASPIDVSSLVREMLLEPMQACVLTSATLAVGGSFEYTKRRLGIRSAEEIRTPSEFNYREQALLYLPAQMPDPRSPQFPAAATSEIREILRRSDGRAFVLFTSYAMLREVERELAPVLDYPVIVQGSAPRSALLREFRSLGNAVLLATSSFWQGVDVVGEALSCVIIDKLPFSSPADPVTAARIEAVNASGDSGFTSYQVPQAVLTLLQGLGRLIRHRQDRGVLAVLDPRIRTKSYGRTFLQAMPPAPTTSDVEDIARFFNR
jgi:ATP-dependent DNA helicase DinG